MPLTKVQNLYSLVVVNWGGFTVPPRWASFLRKLKPRQGSMCIRCVVRRLIVKCTRRHHAYVVIVMFRYHCFDFDTRTIRYRRNIAISISITIFSKWVSKHTRMLQYLLPIQHCRCRLLIYLYWSRHEAISDFQLETDRNHFFQLRS